MWPHVATLQFFRCADKNKAFSRQHRCFSAKVMYSGLTTQGDESSLECFFVVAPAKAKIRPRPAQGLISIERT